MHAIVVQHERHEGEGAFGPALERHGFTLQHGYRCVHATDANADLVVVLGGSMSAADTDRHPFLAAELELLRARLHGAAPCLGLCLGAQLMARAAGAAVFRGAAGLEAGALPIRWTKAAQRDPVLCAPADPTVVAHWHQDTFAPVPGATQLAATDQYAQQGFRLGSSYAFQFHLELDAPTMARWIDGGSSELAAAGLDAGALLAGLAAMHAHAAVQRGLIDRLAAHFARVCSSGVAD